MRARRAHDERSVLLFWRTWVVWITLPGISGTDPVFESPFDGRMAGWRIFKFGTVRGAKRTLVEHREENLDRASQTQQFRRPGGFEGFAVGGAIYRGFCVSKIRDNTTNAAFSHSSNRSTISNSTTINSHLTKTSL